MVFVLLGIKIPANDTDCLATKVGALFVEAAHSLKICHSFNSYNEMIAVTIVTILSVRLTIYFTSG